MRALIEELDAYQQALYPPESNHLVPVDALRRPDVVFLVAQLGSEVVGCGALVDQRGEYGELKRMYVRPSSRGMGVGVALLAALVAQARWRGLRLLRLETGIAQPEALRLYERAGFQRRGPFGAYRDDPLCLFLELELG
ncbi:MAG TPA: GNAT family N-acetyltransferase [Burkholderiaceae bacterium]|nr:GNAT family N-acetyltransferase [Burkholderiaceae bacterium]